MDTGSFRKMKEIHVSLVKIIEIVSEVPLSFLVSLGTAQLQYTLGHPVCRLSVAKVYSITFLN